MPNSPKFETLFYCGLKFLSKNQQTETKEMRAKQYLKFGVLTAAGITANHLCSEGFSHQSLLLPLNISHALIRSSRAVFTIGFTIADYNYSLRGLHKDSEEFRSKLSQVHVRSAKRILKLCENNKGFYVKAGQFVAALRQVPKEYTTMLSILQDQVVPWDFQAIKKVLVCNLDQDLSEIFVSFDEHPIAAASIAQVHHAMLKDGQEVAVKVQYPGLENQLKVDTATMSFLSKSVAWFFPDYRFDWLVTEFVAAISPELDFIQEAKNSERTAEYFKHNNRLKVPSVFWELTTKMVLTMEFCRGQKVDNVEFLKEMGIDPVKVSKALVEVFAEMIFVHGFVHGDPHPGNILVSPDGRNDFRLVLLDHGLCKQLDEDFRLQYCQLWKALIFLDSQKIRQLGQNFGIGEFSRYLPIVLMGRTIDSKSVLGKGMSNEENMKLKQELKSLKIEDVFSFMESLPPDLLAILRIDGLLRSQIRILGAPQQVRLLTYVKYATRGLSTKINPESDSAVKVAFCRLKNNLTYLQVRLVLDVLQLISWMEKVKQLLYALCTKIIGSGFVV